MNFADRIKEILERGNVQDKNKKPEGHNMISAINNGLKKDAGNGGNNEVIHYSAGSGVNIHPAQAMYERVIEEFSGVSHEKLVFSADAAIVPRDVVLPSPAQTGERAATWSAAFLSEINIIPVTQDKGEVLYLGPTDPLARTGIRAPRDSVSMDQRFYYCQQVNFDTSISYSDLNRFSGLENYPRLVRAAVDNRRNLDLLLIGFNGTHHADVSNPEIYPNREDCGMGWLEKYRTEARERVISGLSVSSRETMTTGTHYSIDGLIQDVWGSAIDERWHYDLVAVCNYSLLHRKHFPLINNLDTSRMNTEILVNEKIIKNPMLGNLPAVTAPFFPEDAVLITSLKNLSLYWQEGSIRKLIKDEPHYDRLAFYESWNEDYIIENYEAGCLIDGITWK
ncbi:phage capsid protein [Salmonella enterica]|nr:phage capsid protein [Salmonella enterica]EBJ6878611.1 phage capsid protein [Salmonella enterica]EBK9824807.1 phage capsid protein [Salmonella enterica]EDL3245074.1 phage capsid protein [Salmonella enterica subsp. enterica serovar Newport]